MAIMSTGQDEGLPSTGLRDSTFGPNASDAPETVLNNSDAG
jgi:hypothetical protein